MPANCFRLSDLNRFSIQRANIYYLEKCRVLGQRRLRGISVGLSEGKSHSYWNIPTANKQRLLCWNGNSKLASRNVLSRLSGVMVGFARTRRTPLCQQHEADIDVSAVPAKRRSTNWSTYTAGSFILVYGD